MKPAEFSKTVINIVEQKKCTYLEAIAEVCTNSGTEYEKVKALLTPAVLEHLTAEAQTDNLIPKIAKLPFV